VFAVVLAKGSVLKAIAMILMGLLLSSVGSDIETGQSRMAFDIPELADGIGFVVVAMGVFGYAEIMRNLETTESRDIVQSKITGLMPTMKDLKDSAGAIGRGTILGSILGAIFVPLLPILTRWFLEDFGWLFFSQGDLLNAIPNLRLIMFGGLIIFFLVVEPEGLNRLWRNIRNYFRVWPFSY